MVIFLFQPPPPGIAPNQAQVATAYGQPVEMSQRPNGWFEGANHGGYVIW